MLAIQKSKKHQGAVIPNVLPCRIHHSGPIGISKRHWAPFTSSDGKHTSYFRGRKLSGKALKLPDGYKGAVLSKTDRTLLRADAPGQEEDDDGEDEEPEVGVMEEIADFEEIMVWGHEVLPDEKEDPYIKGLEEWIEWAEKIHGFEGDGKEFKEGKKS